MAASCCISIGRKVENEHKDGKSERKVGRGCLTNAQMKREGEVDQLAPRERKRNGERATVSWPPKRPDGAYLHKNKIDTAQVFYE